MYIGIYSKVNNFCKMMHMIPVCVIKENVFTNISFVRHSLIIYFTSSCVKMNFEKKNEIWNWRQSLKQLNRK